MPADAVPAVPGRRWQRFRRQRLAMASALLIVLLVLATASAPLVAELLHLDASTVDLFNRFAPSSETNPLGTDELGRDLLLRLLEGGRISLLVGVLGALGAAVVGTALGLVSGYVGGRLDAWLMRFTDGVIALPLLPLLIVLAAVDLEKLGVPAVIAHSEQASVWRIVVLLVLFGWTTVARLVRAQVLSLRERDFVRAARALGAGPGRLMLAHILPNASSPIIVATTLSIGNLILAESVLSFLGLGIQPPLASWGNMLTNAQELVQQAPQLAVLPGLLIFLTVIAFNLLGDGLEHALDPRADTRRG